MVTIKLDELEVARLVNACNTGVAYYDDLINSTTPFTKEALDDFAESKSQYKALSMKLSKILLEEDSIDVG